MHREQLKAVFDRQAAGYDKQWARMSPILDGLHHLLVPIFADLPVDARILCVGAGTGIEISYMASRFPKWTFTAIEPSIPMLDVCRQRAYDDGYISRCEFHEGYLTTLPSEDSYHAATCFLVSQFILDRTERAHFFRSIAERLLAGGILASADLSWDVESASYTEILRTWISLMNSGGVLPQVMENTRAAYAKDVGILPPEQVESIILSAGFSSAIQFYQAGLMHAWYSKKASNENA